MSDIDLIKSKFDELKILISNLDKNKFYFAGYQDGYSAGYNQAMNEKGNF